MQTVVEALALDMGHKPRTVMQWRRRGHVPYRYRVGMMAEAVKRGVSLAEADLDNLSLVRPRDGDGGQGRSSSEERPSANTPHVSISAPLDKLSNAAGTAEAA